MTCGVAGVRSQNDGGATSDLFGDLIRMNVIVVGVGERCGNSRKLGTSLVEAIWKECGVRVEVKSMKISKTRSMFWKGLGELNDSIKEAYLFDHTRLKEGCVDTRR